MIFGPLQLFVFAGLFTPGPNVILIIASGAQFGLRRTLPHVFGIVIGVGIIGLVSGLGVGVVLTQFPIFKSILQVIAVLWILWMATGLWRSTSVSDAATSQPMTFTQALLFQWVNPKLWAIALSGSSFLIEYSVIKQSLHLGLTLSITNLFVCFFWACFGQLLSGLLEAGKPRIMFIRIMACLLGLSAVLVIW